MRMEYTNPPLGTATLLANLQNELCANFKDLLSQYPEVDTNAMGFPQGWENEPLWKQ